MKDFFKFTLATVVGLILTGVLVFVLGVISIFTIVSSAETETMVRKNSVMILDLNGVLNERVPEDFYSLVSQITGENSGTYGLDDILASIKKAKEHDDVKAIYIKTRYLQTSYASLQAIRNALIDFKESGKPVIAYSDMYTQGMYYLSSVADKVLLNPQGVVEWKGLSASPMFYKDMLEKLGIEMQVFKVGTYKSAVEPFTSTEMSEANREQVTAFLESIWGQMIDGVGKSRSISKVELNNLADEMLMFYPAEKTVQSGLVDTLIYQNDVRDYIKKIIDVDEDSKLRTLSLSDMIHVKRNVPKDKSGEILAVYYASGEIVDYATGGINQGDEIVGSKVIRDLRKLKENDDVKAVVLRVNSPGGSAFASEQIWHAVKELKAEKPVIVSMGNYAASGGYYISCIADTIVAEPTTLTGSIGIFGMFPSVKGLANKIGLSSSTVKTNTYADFGNMMQPLNANEKELMQMMITRGYFLFVDRCAEGRHTTREAIEKVAEGRVWTGEMAKELGLVDELGGMERAMEIAVAKAGLERYTVKSYPAKESFLSTLMSTSPSNYIKAQLMKTELGSYFNEFNILNNLEKHSMIQARIPFELNVK